MLPTTASGLLKHCGGATSMQHSSSRQYPSEEPTSLLVVGSVAIGIAIVLMFAVAMISHNKHERIANRFRVLGQSAPNDLGYHDITIPQGTLRGFTRKSRQGREFTAFYKVPYAEPPVGELRFKDPVAPRGGWEGIREISEVAPQCIQKEKYAEEVRAVGEEDCLYANIYLPSTESRELLPTMVYIHGGGFTDGNGSRYGPEYFMDEDVVLLTFQYRLGPFGFLNTNDDVIRGNMGFKDQVQMLQWTKSNIHHFGGDPDRITIYGNSAGGMSVSFHMLSPLSTGLFHRAITQSGASMCTGMGLLLDRHPEKTVAEVEKELGCNANDTTKFVECLKTKDASDIALVRNYRTVYGLTLENRTNDLGQVFMPYTPYSIVHNNPNSVPYIVVTAGTMRESSTDHNSSKNGLQKFTMGQMELEFHELNCVLNGELTGEAVGIMSSEQMVNLLNENWDGLAGTLLMVNMTVEQLESVKDFYFGERPIGNETLRETIDMVSDRGLVHCSYLSAQLHGEYSPTYLYYVTKPPYKSYADKVQQGFPAKEMGILSHADELQYFFLYDGYPEITADDQEYFEFSKYLVKTWATFARDGEPQKEWARATGQSETFWMELNDKPSGTEKLKKNMHFWDGFTHQQLKYAD